MVWTSEENALEISLQIKTELKEIWAEVAASNSSSNLPMLEKKVHQGSSILHLRVGDSSYKCKFIHLNKSRVVCWRDLYPPYMS